MKRKNRLSFTVMLIFRLYVVGCGSDPKEIGNGDIVLPGFLYLRLKMGDWLTSLKSIGQGGCHSRLG